MLLFGNILLFMKQIEGYNLNYKIKITSYTRKLNIFLNLYKFIINRYMVLIHNYVIF